MALSSDELVQHARSTIQNLSPAQVADELQRGDAVLVDVRDAPELAEGRIPGSVHASRGMLEFHADPNCAFHKEGLNPNQRIILHCAFGSRSALAVQTLQTMGYTDIAHLDGGFHAWQAAGLPVEK